MRALHKKLRRDIFGSYGTLLTVVAIIAVGVGSFVGLLSAQRILLASRDVYYREYRFADFWIDVKKAPQSAVELLAENPAIESLETRVVFDVILDLPDQPRPISGRLISTPEVGFERTLNGIHLVRGSGFSDTRDEEVILSEAFAVAHDLNPGDRLRLILNRKIETFLVVGTAISPEYVYMVRGAGDIVPDPQHFGILYVKDEYARDVLDFRDACNQITGRLVPGAAADINLLLERFKRDLDPYGVFAVTPRERQASHRFLSDEINGLGITATFMPAIFLTVAALVLNILLTRLAERQRTIIGTLKAIGYRDRAVFTHFLSFGIVVGIIGGLAGAALGVLLSSGMIQIYRGFFQFPTFAFQVFPDLLLAGVLISVTFAVAGAAKGVWVVLKLSPADAMRPRPPERGGAIILERFPRLWRALGFRTHMALRSLVRNRTRTLTGCISTALAVAIIMMSLVMYDSMLELIDFQYERVSHSDVDIGMRDEKSIDALYEARSLPGVDYAEPLFGLRCDLQNGRRGRRLTITGLTPGHRLMTPVQTDGRPIDIPPDGLVMGRKLAEILNLEVGDHLDVTPIRGQRETVRARLTGVMESFLGLECYADLRYLSRIVGESVAVNSMQLAVAPGPRGELYNEIKELPNAQGVSSRADARANLEATLIKTSLLSLSILIIFAGVIAFGSMLNNSLIEIGDRLRDISTLRVIGYRPTQVAGIFFRQNMVVFVLGLLIAAPIAYAMILGLSAAYDTELYRLPVIIRPRAVLSTTAISVVFVLIAQWVVYRKIRTLDWLEGVKVKE